MVEDNKDKSDSSSLHLIVFQIAQDNQRAAKKPIKNAKVISDNEI